MVADEVWQYWQLWRLKQPMLVFHLATCIFCSAVPPCARLVCCGVTGALGVLAVCSKLGRWGQPSVNTVFRSCHMYRRVMGGRPGLWWYHCRPGVCSLCNTSWQFGQPWCSELSTHVPLSYMYGRVPHVMGGLSWRRSLVCCGACAGCAVVVSGAREALGNWRQGVEDCTAGCQDSSHCAALMIGRNELR